MRVFAFLVFFSFLLLGGKSYATVSENQKCTSVFSKYGFSQNYQFKNTNENHTITIIEDVSVDFEEEFHPENDAKDTAKPVNFTRDFGLVHSFYNQDRRLSNLHPFNSRQESFPYLNGNSCPIYIVQQVFRI